MNRIYEELYIQKPDTPEEEIDAFIGQLKDLITAGHGTVDKVDKWGTRKLAYRISKCSEGAYTLIVFTAPAELVHEIERRMRVTDSVIKFITVRIDEKMKKIEKRKKARDKRAARKPPAPAAPAAPIMPASPAEPSSVAPGLPEAVKAPEVKAPDAPEMPKAPEVEAVKVPE
jgi:small subunit ribosomal protein S6